jgi:predicted transposase/invertase (TIGR01784 family)
VSIYILGSNHLDEPGFHNVITMMNKDSGRVYADLSEIHFLELEKLEGNLKSPSTALEKWMQAFLHSDQYCLDTGSVPKEMNKEEVIMKALNLIKQANSDEETKHLIDLRHKSQLDFNSITDEARQEGWQEGIQVGEQRGADRGRLQALETVAFQMLSMNLPIDTIITATGLEESQIEELAQVLNRQKS